ncbi:MAG TPA: response regulator [Chloroflexota bacterium]|jgi:DNA-binding response OmpR family regulator
MRPQPVVLVVDDDESLGSLVRAALEPEAYTVETVTAARPGLARLEAGAVDLVLLDVMLPDVDGLELCRRIRAHPSLPYIPIIMLTALAEPADRHAGFSAGADDYLGKPFSVQELLDRVRVWVRVRQYLASQGSQSHEPTGEDTLLEMALATSHDLTRLLMLLLTALEEWESTSPAPRDLRRMRTQFQDAAAVIASRINLLTRQAHAVRE